MTATEFDRHELIQNYAETCVDDMDLKEMTAILIDNIIESFDDFTDEELIIQVKECYPELLNDTHS